MTIDTQQLGRLVRLHRSALAEEKLAQNLRNDAIERGDKMSKEAAFQSWCLAHGKAAASGYALQVITENARSVPTFLMGKEAA